MDKEFKIGDVVKVIKIIDLTEEDIVALKKHINRIGVIKSRMDRVFTNRSTRKTTRLKVFRVQWNNVSGYIFSGEELELATDREAFLYKLHGSDVLKQTEKGKKDGS